MVKYKMFLLLICLGFINPVAGQHTVFTHDFAPSDDYVKPVEKPYRVDVCLNGSWSFFPLYQAGKLSGEEIMNPAIPENPVWESTPLKVPSPWNVNSFAKGNGGDFITYPSYPQKWESVRAGWLMRKIPYNTKWKDKRIILHFDAVNGYTQVFVNNQKAGENFDLFLPFDLDITNLIKANGDNVLMVWVADAKLLDQPGRYGRRPYVGGSFWGSMITGIWQDVYLVVKPQINIESTFAEPFIDRDELDVQAVVSNESSKEQMINVSGSIKPWINLSGKGTMEAPVPTWKLGEEVLELPENKIMLAPNTTRTIYFKVKVSGKLKAWTPETPNLYGIVMKIDYHGKTIDQSYSRFGWRQVTLHGDKVYLNGEQIRFKGDSWHFMGIPQMTRRYAWAWFTMLKQANANAVRLHAEPYPSFYLDMADEMGMLILDETGMWASDGGPKIDSKEYWERSEDHLKRFIKRDRNHPSVLGWSVCNENIPVAVNVLHAPDSLVKKQLSEINKWVSITQKLDSTRMWISGDGETDLPTNLPTIIGHYGDENSYKTWSSQGKVWGVGECGMAYYGTPRQTSVYNGERSYVSQEGRMEALGIEAKKLLNLQKKYGASYLSVFNIVWYGLKPLELGLKDTTKPPGADDGIFFGPYKEGQPGVQPERLGPYTTTFNPGYDPSLPLYKPWPLFYAVREAFSNIKVETTTGDKIKKKQAPITVKNTGTLSLMLISGDKDSLLYKAFRDMGIDIMTEMKTGKEVSTLIIIDGKHPEVTSQTVSIVKSGLEKGGKVFVLGVQPESLNNLNEYFPEPLELTSRPAYSFITNNQDDVINTLENSDFYFAEISRQPMMNYGLSGQFTNNSIILLKACNTDWRRWNNRPEYMKTGSVIRSERESKAAGNTMVVQKSGNGKIYVLSLDPETLFKINPLIIGKMLMNLGVKIKNVDPGNISALNADGVLENSVVIGSFNIEGKDSLQIAEADFLKGVEDEKLAAGNDIHNRAAVMGRSLDGVFDFKAMNLKGPEEHAVAYLSFWIYSPRSLVNLLAEPDMPRLDMLIGADDGYQVSLNQKQLALSLKPGGLVKREHTISAIPLEKGWNHFIIKSIKYGGDWKMSVEFTSNNKAFMHEIKSQAAH
jgi:beta-galactosidase